MIARMQCLIVAAALLQPAAAEAQAQYRLTGEQRFGAAEGPLALAVPGSVFVGADGTLVVTQPAAATVRVFDAFGRATATIGRRGDGPDEFERPMSAGLSGDTVWVVDPLRYRITLFSRAGRLLHSFTWMSPELAPWRAIGSFQRFQKADVAISGEFVLDAARPFPVTLHDTVGAVTDTIAFIDMRRSGTTMAGRRVESPLHDGPMTTFSPAGDRLIVIDRRVPPSGAEPTFSITWIDTVSRDTLQRATFRYAPRPIFEPYINAQATDDLRAALRAQAWMPPISAMIASDDGTVWAARERVPGALRRWYRFALDGRAVGFIDLPNRSHIGAARDDHVWIVERGEGEVAYVVRYRIDS